MKERVRTIYHVRTYVYKLVNMYVHDGIIYVHDGIMYVKDEYFILWYLALISFRTKNPPKRLNVILTHK